jgi:hypothetical protein
MKFHIDPEDLPSPERVAEWLDKIESLREYARRDLSRWERDFLDSIEAQLKAKGVWTRGQREKLQEIYAEHMGDDDAD